jgi:hypothetical protein
MAAGWGVRGGRQGSPRRLFDRDRARRYVILWLECVEKVVRPLALFEIDALDTSICWRQSPRRDATAAVTATAHRFFGFLDDS